LDYLILWCPRTLVFKFTVWNCFQGSKVNRKNGEKKEEKNERGENVEVGACLLKKQRWGMTINNAKDETDK
jgi:hypothetical protein